MIKWMALPYALDALAPIISAETLKFHHGAHHRIYVEVLNGLLPGTAYEGLSLEQIIRNSHQTPGDEKIFNNAAQVWNHDFYWLCLCPPSEHLTLQDGPFKTALEKTFGSMETFLQKFLDNALAQFGSGWVWLVRKPDGSVNLRKTGNADLPLVYGEQALFTCDVWEHAYYLDYQNCRKVYVEAILQKLISWTFVEKMYAQGL